MTATTITITIATTTPIIQYGRDGSGGEPMSAVLNKEKRFGMLVFDVKMNPKRWKRRGNFFDI